jgi:hypothetical protein
MEVSGQLHTSAALPPRKEPQYPLDRRLWGPQSQYGCFRVDRNLLSLPGIEPRPFSPQPVPIIMQLEKYFLSTSQFTSNYSGRLLGVNARIKLKLMLEIGLEDMDGICLAQDGN